jgi:GntR family transcriptional regulator/MocR family aminotransferase
MDPATILDLDGRGPRYQQIGRAIVAAIDAGRFRPGARLPSTRELARDLGCSRNVVILAYEHLVLEGYVTARARDGMMVTPALGEAPPPAPPRPRPLDSRVAPTGPPLARAGEELCGQARAARRLTAWVRGLPADFMFGVCEPDDRLLGRLQRELGRALVAREFGYTTAAGDAALRTQVAERLRRARGVERPAGQIVITNGAQQAFDLCARLLVGRGDRVVVEDPGYEAARAALAATGARVVPVPVDDRGLVTDALPRGRVRLAYVTPSHQFPTGVVLPIDRRLALVAWARAHGAYILEDDYDGEIRYGGAPVRALAGLDTDDRVIYCGTFAKALFPAVRLGYLSLPARLVDAVADAKWLTDRGSSALLQRAIAALMASGAYDRHMRRLRRRYGTRRALVLRELRRHLDGEIDVTGADAGFHVVVWFKHLPAEAGDAMADACRRRGVGIYALTPLALRPLARAAVILGYGVVRDEEIERGICVLASVYRRLRSRA